MFVNEKYLKRSLSCLVKVKYFFSASQRRHARVHKWSRNVDIFSKDLIFIPLNESAHWYLAVICYPGEYVSKGWFLKIAVKLTSDHSDNNDFVLFLIGAFSKKSIARDLPKLKPRQMLHTVLNK